MTAPGVILLGGGGHARVLAYTLRLCGYRLLGYTAPKDGRALSDVAYIGGDEAVAAYRADDVRLVNAVGGVGDTKPRAKLFCAFKERGYEFLTVTHPSCIIAPDVSLEEGAQVLAGTVVMSSSTIGRNTIVNTRASIDHDCRIGSHVHIAPGVTLSAGVTVEDEAHIGTGATIIQGVTVGRNAIVGAGAVVVKTVSAGLTVVGVPARPRSRRG